LSIVCCPGVSKAEPSAPHVSDFELMQKKMLSTRPSVLMMRTAVCKALHACLPCEANRIGSTRGVHMTPESYHDRSLLSTMLLSALEPAADGTACPLSPAHSPWRCFSLATGPQCLHHAPFNPVAERPRAAALGQGGTMCCGPPGRGLPAPGWPGAAPPAAIPTAAPPGRYREQRFGVHKMYHSQLTEGCTGRRCQAST
jgi:hypothetical protein